MRMSILLPSYLLAWLAVGCSSASTDFPPTSFPSELTECTVDEDCAVYEIGCCSGECNGGVPVSLRADTPAAVVDSFRETCTRDTLCTEIACSAVVAVCNAGTCDLP